MEDEVVVVSGGGFDPFTERFTWNHAMVIKLIEEYKRLQHVFKDSGTRKRDLWRKIAQRFEQSGYPYVTEEMCDIKWRNLKKTFKEIYVGQQSSNSQAKTKWCYYEVLKDIFGKDPNIVSAASVAVSTKPYLATKKILDSDGKEIEVELMEVIGASGEDYLEEEEDDEAELVDGHYLESYTSSNTRQPPLWFAQFLQQYRSEEAKRTEMLRKMHAEIIAIEKRKCDLLAQFVENLGNSSAKTENSHTPDV